MDWQTALTDSSVSTYYWQLFVSLHPTALHITDRKRTDIVYYAVLCCHQHTVIAYNSAALINYLQAMKHTRFFCKNQCPCVLQLPGWLPCMALISELWFAPEEQKENEARKTATVN